MVILSFDTAEAERRSRLADATRLIRSLLDEFADCASLDDRLMRMLRDSRVEKAFSSYPELENLLSHGSVEEGYVLALSVVLGQFDRLFDKFHEVEDRSGALKCFLDILVSTERFYKPIGGLLGYYAQTLQLLETPGVEERPSYAPPPVYDMRQKTRPVWEYSYEGIRRLKEAGAVFTVGGAGDRFKLTDPQTGLALPVACLVFGGRPLLEWLFRDLEALEYLHYRVFGEKISLPVLLMASHEKKNVQEIERLGLSCGWFGKASDRISVIVQPLVPTVTLDGQWAISGPLQLIAKPGGHGVIWKLAQDLGAFRWLEDIGAASLFVRQINNPLGGMDHTLASLIGIGLKEGKAFGFAACPPHPGLAEGMNVLAIGEDGEAGITNIEYTKFKEERAANPRLFEQQCPSNTNILFASLRPLSEALRSASIPGMMVNAKVEAEVVEGGQKVLRPVARLESMMQAIADAMRVPWGGDPEKLATFLALYDREKSMSVTKKAAPSGPETPEYCLYDWYRAGRRLLAKSCSFELPDELSFEQFLEHGPNLSFFFHPALGPLWELIGQKVRYGRLLPGSELELEIAEVYVRNLTLQGSFRLLCDAVTGASASEGVRQVGKCVGQAYLENVSIENDGLEAAPMSAFVARTVPRKACCTIRLDGSSELVAKDIVIRGDFSLTVPDGMRSTLRQTAGGGVEALMEPWVSRRPLYEVTWKPGEVPFIK